MRFTPLYRVTYENYKPQYFFNREVAEDFRKQSLGDLGNVDITYWYSYADAVAKVEQNGGWQNV